MKVKEVALSKEKLNGRFYTPEFIVDNILDLSGYFGATVLRKHVIDNSCGDGAFLVEVVKRYCNEFLKQSRDLQMLAKELENYIHGIEIDKIECCKCIENLNRAVMDFRISEVCWDIQCADALTVDKYNGKMDFVLGNPPYIRVHNLGESFNNIRKFVFAQCGMTDLYIVFYEIGLKMLNDEGVLGYIAPSSFFNSIAAQYMRSYFVKNNLIDKIVDLEHYQAFKATTYTSITVLKKNRRKNETDYFKFDGKTNRAFFVDTLNVGDYFINGKFYFACKEELSELKNILAFKHTVNRFSVKNGFATLADGFFIGNFDFEDYIIPVIKASTGKCCKCIFPYSNAKLVPYNELTKNPSVKLYFEKNKESLMKRSLEKRDDWYGFGRSQGIGDVNKRKFAVNTLIKTLHDLKITECDKGVGVYSGLYILTDISEEQLKDILLSKDFLSYVSLLGKYKNGGYYTFSSRDLKNYLEYKYSQKIDVKGVENEQYTVFGNT